MTKVEKLLQELIAISSVTGNEIAIIEELDKRLSSVFDITNIPVDEHRSNLLCVKGSPRILLVAHVDTVTGEVEQRIDDEFIFGRGSCDNKGAASAMIIAALKAHEEGLEDFGLLFTIGEESTFDGAIAARDHFKKNEIEPERIMIGEPTELEIVNAQFGIFCIEVSCTGTAEHSSTFSPNSAIHNLTKLLSHMLDLSLTDTTFHISHITGGVAENVIAPNASATIVFRSAHPNIADIVTEHVSKSNTEHASRVVKSIAPVDHSLEGDEPCWAPYFTEMAFLSNSVVCGPGSIADAHTDNERVSREQLNRAVDVYHGFLVRRDAANG